MQGEGPAEVVQHVEEVQTSPVEKLKAAISIAQAMPPSKLRKNLVGLSKLAPEIEDNLMEKVELPLQLEEPAGEKPFLKTEFNRDGDSYRSPHTDNYYPEAQGYHPAPAFRQLQQLGTILFEQYIKLYYGGDAIGSFFVTENGNPDKFSMGFFAKKVCEESQGGAFAGSWDSFNVADVRVSQGEATVKLTTTILIEMAIGGQSDLTGFLKQSRTQSRELGKEGLAEVIGLVGEMVQQLQTVMRQHLQTIYIGKTQEIIYTTRYENTVQEEEQRKKLANELRGIHIGAK